MNEDRFKFRVWDKKLKKMGFFELQDLVFCIQTQQPTGRHYDLGFSLDNEDTVMQSTGLRDKNGVLIFEGDILHITQHYGDDGDFMGEVKFNDESCAFEVEDNLEGYILGEFDYENCEIIGNIHEHPRLLEKGND